MTTERLRIGELPNGKAFQVGPDLVTQKLAFLGRTGSGKTYAAMKAAEEMLDCGMQVIVLDVVGVWWGLRLDADGKSPGIDIPILGGLRGDIPLEPTGGALVADLLVDRRQSVILDLSQFESDKAKSRFAADFADRFFRRMKAAPAAVHVFLEECQELVPQNLMKGEEMMLHYWTRLSKLGRNFGIGLSLISQRPQEVNKKVLNMTEFMLAFQMRGKQERETVKDWNDHLDTGRGGAEIVKMLPSLPRGHAYASSPQWLAFEGVVHIGQKRTFDSSSTPEFKAGLEFVPAKELAAPLDLDGLQRAMAATIEEAKANDPAALKRRVAELEAEVEALQAVDRFEAEDRANESELAGEYKRGYGEGKTDGYVRGFNAAREGANRHLREIQIQAAAITDRLRSLQDLQEPMADVEVKAASVVAPAVRETQQIINPPSHKRTAPASSPPMVPPRAREDHAHRNGDGKPGTLDDGQRRILNALRTLESVGVTGGAKRPVVGALSGYSYTAGGGFGTKVGDLVEAGLLTIPAAGMVDLTAAGRALTDAPARALRLRDLHERWLAIIPDSARRVLRALIDAYPEAITRPELGNRSGFTYTAGGGFGTIVGDLVAMGAASLPEKGKVQASDLLFPKGLR